MKKIFFYNEKTKMFTYDNAYYCDGKWFMIQDDSYSNDCMEYGQYLVQDITDNELRSFNPDDIIEKYVDRDNKVVKSYKKIKARTSYTAFCKNGRYFYFYCEKDGKMPSLEKCSYKTER